MTGDVATAITARIRATRENRATMKNEKTEIHRILAGMNAMMTKTEATRIIITGTTDAIVTELTETETEMIESREGRETDVTVETTEPKIDIETNDRRGIARKRIALDRVRDRKIERLLQRSELLAIVRKRIETNWHNSRNLVSRLKLLAEIVSLR